MRITTESLDELGNVESTTVTEKRTHLKSVDRRHVQLKMAVTVQVADKTFDAPPQDIVESHFGEVNSKNIKIADLGEATTMIEGRVVACRVRQCTIITPENKRVVKIFYSAKVAPHVLRRESSTTDVDGKRNTYVTQDEVIALDMPHKVLSEIMPASLVRTVNRNGRNTTTTIAVQAANVPGGVVSYTSKETDAQGRVIRRSTLELIDYGFEKDSDGKEVDEGARNGDSPRRTFSRSTQSARSTRPTG